MVLLRKLEIAGFRGAVAPLSIDLTSSCRSIAIFGENAAGKSSITDAIEWFYTNRVEHLWRENCKETALRNTLIDDKTPSTVAFEFNTPSLNCKKSLSPQLESFFSNRADDFKKYILQVQEGHERITLRNLELLNFIVQRKAEKRQELERIIGYESLDAFKETIGQTLYKLERSQDYIANHSSKIENQKEIVRIVGTSVHNEKELYNAASRLAKQAGLDLDISGDESYNKAIEKVQEQIYSKEKATRKLALSDCKNKCSDVSRRADDAGKAFDLFAKKYSELVKSEEQLKQVKLVGFLSLGQQAIAARLVPQDMCPLCLQSKDWTTLTEELRDRISRLQERKRQFDESSELKNQVLAKLNEAIQAGHELITYATKKQIEGAFLKEAEHFNASAAQLVRRITEDFQHYKPITSKFDESTIALTGVIKQEIERLRIAEEQLALSAHEQKLLVSFQAMENLRKHFTKFRTASESLAKFDAQIQTLSRIKNEFSLVHTNALQKALGIMSKDISRYYLAMHPKENIDDIRLTVLEDGVEFEYAFHGKKVYPPLKYLSESHLNSLGIAAFLASVKAFNKKNGFIILDDIVTSFDANHRVRLIHLLKTEFSEWQIILLTHEPFWFEMVKREMASNSWLYYVLENAPIKGIELKSSSKDAKAKLASKKADGTVTANDVRNGLERFLKEIGFALEVKMAFRFNDQNERRMPGELLSELRSTLNKKSPMVLSNAVFGNLESSNLIATTGSHDSGPVLSSGDIITTCEDVLNLDDQFRCSDCNTYTSVERLVEHEKKIYCKCGKRSLDWKR